MLTTLKNSNPKLNIHHINSSKFKQYGNIISPIDIAPLKNWFMQNIYCETNNTNYIADACLPLDLVQAIKPALATFGELKTEIGFCWGKNTKLNGLEYHKSIETTIALTDILLILGHIWHIDNNTYDTSLAEIFYVPAGQTFELYSTTLHYCPIMTNESGFATCVILPHGTNTPLDDNRNYDELLFMKNKWLLCHRDNLNDINAGGIKGLIGENITINLP